LLFNWTGKVEIPMASFVYILGSRGKGGARSYVGWTTDLEKRLRAHNDGTGARSTRGRQWRLLYAERYINRGEAMSREWRLKRDRRFRKQLVAQFDLRTRDEREFESRAENLARLRPGPAQRSI
jgi:putative endonuclease